MNVLIVDDEPLAREGLRLLLADQPGIGRVIEARDGAEAVALIRAEQPDLVLLDVQMPEMSGFEVLQRLGDCPMPPVIFVTAHDAYAIRAFEVNAVDYLLKPVARERFAQAMGRVRERAALDRDDGHLRELLRQIAAPPAHLTRIAVRAAGRISFVNVDDVRYVQAAENYVQLHLATSRHLLHVPIATLEASLDPRVFLRIHRSFIVNTRAIEALETGPHGEYVVVLAGGTRLQAGRSHHDKIRRWAANPF